MTVLQARSTGFREAAAGSDDGKCRTASGYVGGLNRSVVFLHH